MNNERTLPNSYYRIATAISLIAIVFFSYVSESLAEELWIYSTIAFAVAEAAVFIKKYRHDRSPWYELMQSCILPLSLFLFLHLSETRGLIRASEIGLIIILICSLLYIGILIAVNVVSRNKWKNADYVKKVIAIGLYNIRSFVVVILSLQLLYMACVFPIRHGSTSSEPHTLKVWSEERTIAGHYEKLKVLSNEDEFADSTDSDERFEMFNCAVDVESNYLGIPYELSVKTGNLDEGVAAEYCDSEKTITIDKNFLNDCTAEDLIKTAAHECRHGYQCQLIRLYEKVKDDEESMIFLDEKLEHVKDYMNEFKDYKDCGDSVEEYASQYCEKDSYLYAEASYDKWIERLDEIGESEG